MNRMRTTVAVLGVTGALTVAQLGLAGGASATDVSTQDTKCGIKITFLTKFYVDQNNRVTNGGLKFGLTNTTKKQTFNSVSLKVQNVKSLRFGKATVTTRPIGRITQKTDQTVKIAAKTLKPGKSAAFKVSTRLLKNRYEAKFTLYGKTPNGKRWSCPVDGGTWGNIH